MPVLVLGRGSNLVVSDGVRWAGNPLSDLHSAASKSTGPRCVPAVPPPGTGGTKQRGGRSDRARVLHRCSRLGRRSGASERGVLRHGDKRLPRGGFDRSEDGIIGRFGPDDLELSYRHSNVTSTRLVLAATFRSRPGDVDTGRAELRRITRWRRDNQPGGTFNAGSVFKNPVGATAGEIIDSLGLKGMRVGDVAVSEKHANFFVAGSSATSEDIRRLVVAVKDRVFEQTGTMLEPEIQFVGFDDEN